MTKLLFPPLYLCATLGLRAEDGHQLWLRPHAVVPVTVVALAQKSAVHLPIPAAVEPPMHTLEAVIANDLPPHRGTSPAQP